jgi:hypothetical protein
MLGVVMMDRKLFFDLIEREYFTMEQGHYIATGRFNDFDIESTDLIVLMADDAWRKELFDFLVKEKSKDNWCFLNEEFVGYFMQMLSTHQSIKGMDNIAIESIETIYYQLLAGILEITGKVSFNMDTVKAVYANHMDNLRTLLLSIMDIEELKAHNL